MGRAGGHMVYVNIIWESDFLGNRGGKKREEEERREKVAARGGKK